MVDWAKRDKDVYEAFRKNGWAMSNHHEGDYEFSVWKGTPSLFKMLFSRRPVSVNLKKGEIRITVWDRAYQDEIEKIASADMPFPCRVDIN